MKTSQQVLDQAREEFEKNIDDVPAISGQITDSDECCNCGEDLALELYDAFSEGYKMAKKDTFSWHTTTLQAFIEAEIERLEDTLEKCMDEYVELYGYLDKYVDGIVGRQGKWIEKALQDQITHLKEIKI